MKQLMTRVDERLAMAVKRRAAMEGESVNSFVTRVLNDAVGGRESFKRDAIASGRLTSRPGAACAPSEAAVSTPAGYAAGLVSADRDAR